MVSPCSLRTFQVVQAGETCGVTLVAFGMRSYPDPVLAAPSPCPSILLSVHPTEQVVVHVTAHLVPHLLLVQSIQLVPT